MYLIVCILEELVSRLCEKKESDFHLSGDDLLYHGFLLRGIEMR